MCEYIIKGGKSFQDSGITVSYKCDFFEKEVAGKKCFAVLWGNISNYNRLRQSMQVKGVTFETEKCAEIVLSTYLAFGKSVFKSFNGEFAGVIWDGYEKELILFRDKVGFKRLFYYFDGQRIAFSSNIKEIFEFPFVKKEPSYDIYCKLFTWSGSIINSETFFNNIYEIQPSGYLSYKSGKLKAKSYYVFDFASSTDSFCQTVNGFDYFLKDTNFRFGDEKLISKSTLYERICKYIYQNCMPSPYLTLTDLSNSDSKEKICSDINLFTIPKRFKLPIKACEEGDRELINDFLSEIPLFEYRDEKDISRKEELYIKTSVVLPSVIAAKRSVSPNIAFPYLEEKCLAYSIKSERYRERLLKSYFYHQKYKPLKNNVKGLKSLFYEMIKNESFMFGMISKEEILKFTRLFPRPETMLYLIQVDVWLNTFM